MSRSEPSFALPWAGSQVLRPASSQGGFRAIAQGLSGSFWKVPYGVRAGGIRSAGIHAVASRMHKPDRHGKRLSPRWVLAGLRPWNRSEILFDSIDAAAGSETSSRPDTKGLRRLLLLSIGPVLSSG